jgi:hypothetical protein
LQHVFTITLRGGCRSKISANTPTIPTRFLPDESSSFSLFLPGIQPGLLGRHTGEFASNHLGQNGQLALLRYE